MRRALTLRLWREHVPMLVLLIVGAALFEGLYLLFVHEVLAELLETIVAFWLERLPIRKLMSTFLGGELGPDLSPTALMSIGTSHPILNALTWTLIFTLGTRIPVGEIDRGTADLLLSLPLSRRSIYLSASLALLVPTLAISAAPLLGIWVADQFIPLTEPLKFDRLAVMMTNAGAVNIALAGLTLLASSVLTRRGRAVGAVLAVLFVSLLIQFLAAFWDPAEDFEFVSIFAYYKAMAIATETGFPTRDVLILLAVAVTTWLGGWFRFVRRDIPAV